MAEEHDNKDNNKRQWFEQYVTRSGSGLIEPEKDGFWYTCPCCGYPTLTERGGYDICCLCNWEDDGQDNPLADEVWGGPNGRYSLAEARANFKQYWVMYSPDNDTRITAGDSTVTLKAKRVVAEAFDAMEEADEQGQARLWDTVRDGRATLDQELHRGVREYEQRLRKKKLAEGRRD